VYQQNYDEAKSALAKLSADKNLDADFRLSVDQIRAEVYAIVGDLELAEKVYDQAASRISPARRGQLALANLLIHLRRGAFKHVVEMPDEEWYCAEGAFGQASMKRLRVLRAFAMNNLPPTPQTREQIQSYLAGVRPFRRGEFDYLAAKWPELNAFIVEAGLSGDNPAPPVSNATA
jgi:tetratricopeptide (TPR) repeat protein